MHKLGDVPLPMVDVTPMEAAALATDLLHYVESLEEEDGMIHEATSRIEPCDGSGEREARAYVAWGPCTCMCMCTHATCVHVHVHTHTPGVSNTSERGRRNGSAERRRAREGQRGQRFSAQDVDNQRLNSRRVTTPGPGLGAMKRWTAASIRRHLDAWAGHRRIDDGCRGCVGHGSGWRQSSGTARASVRHMPPAA
jgi:hypothetical protein